MLHAPHLGTWYVRRSWSWGVSKSGHVGNWGCCSNPHPTPGGYGILCVLGFFFTPTSPGHCDSWYVLILSLYWSVGTGSFSSVNKIKFKWNFQPTATLKKLYHVWRLCALSVVTDDSTFLMLFSYISLTSRHTSLLRCDLLCCKGVMHKKVTKCNYNTEVFWLNYKCIACINWFSRKITLEKYYEILQ